MPEPLVEQDTVSVRIDPVHVQILDRAGDVAVTHAVPDEPTRLPATAAPPGRPHAALSRPIQEAAFLARFPDAAPFLDGLIRLPEGKVLIPGVIAHTTAVVEHPETVAERLMNFASLVGRERVIAGADCGFAQGALFQRQHPTVMWAKFEALVQGARLASERLWG